MLSNPGIRIFLLSVFFVSAGSAPVTASVVSTANFVVEYDSVDASFARRLSEQAERSLAQIASELNYLPDLKMRIVLASTENSFEKAIGDSVPEWGLAFALIENRKIVLKSPRLLGSGFDLRAVMTHEIAHVMLAQSVGNRRIPFWFHEGFAMYQSKEWKIGNSALVGWAAVRGNLLDLGDLENAFPWSEEKADLAYAESFLAITFIIQRFGKEGLSALVTELKNGKDIDSAMRGAFGVGYERFKRDWYSYTRNRFSILSFLVSPEVIWPFVVILFAIVYIKKQIEKRKKMMKLRYESIEQEDLEFDSNDECDVESGK